MEQIIATTDFSANSKAGMRFAVRLAQARNAELVFLHVHQVLRATFWSDRQYAHYIKRHEAQVLEELTSFVKEVCRSVRSPLPAYRVAVHHNLDTAAGITEYAERHEAAYICISTRGAGTLRKIYGTNTARLITVSRIPVLCIPRDYRFRPVRDILYASDMTDYEYELAQVVAFARPLNARISMLHLSYPGDLLQDSKAVEAMLLEKTGYKVALHYRSRNAAQSLLRELRRAIRDSKPSLLVMFTNPNRSLFDQIFLSSKTKDYSFEATIPLLSISKSSAWRPAR